MNGSWFHVKIHCRSTIKDQTILERFLDMLGVWFKDWNYFLLFMKQEFIPKRRKNKFKNWSIDAFMKKENVFIF